MDLPTRKTTLEDVMSARKRVESGNQIRSLSCTFFLWLCASVCIVVSTGIYLWEYDGETSCKAPNSNKHRLAENLYKDKWVDVSRRYSDVLKIFFSCALVDTFRCIVMIIAVVRKSGPLATLYQALIINDVLGFGAIFVLHVFRFDMAGRICAGEHKDEDAYYPHSGDYLISQGRILQGLVCFVWIVGILLFTLSTCVMICHHKSLVQGIKARIYKAYRSISFVERLGRGNQNDLLNI